MAISSTGNLPVEQVQIVLSAASAKRGGVGLKFLDSSQLTHDQPSERVKPGQAAHHPCNEEV